MKVSMKAHATWEKGWYTLNYRPNGTKGRREREHVYGKQAAEERKAELEGKSVHPGDTPTAPRLRDVVEEYLAWCPKNLAPSTCSSKRCRLEKHIIPALGAYRVEGLTQRILDGYFANAKKTIILLDLSHINGLITWMVKREYATKLTWQPEAPKYSPAVKRLPTPADILAFIRSLKKDVHREACWLMLQSGVRWDELRHARWENYREGSAMLVEDGRPIGEWVRMGEIQLAKTKTDQDEPVTFPLTPWWDANQKTEGFIFSVRRGRMMSTIHRQLKEHSTRTGIHMTPHMFRHACGTYLYEETGDIRAVQVQLRHSKLSTTEIYVRKSVARKRASSKALAGVFKPGG